MKKLGFLLAFLISIPSAFALDIGSADQVYVTPHAGGRGKFSSVDLSKSAAVGVSVLPKANGGWGQSIAASTGVPSLSSGTLTFNTTLPESLGGWGQSIAASTGVPSFASGTLTFNSTLPESLGGWGQSIAASTGVPSLSSGTLTFNPTLPINLGGTGAATTSANLVFSGPSSGSAAAPSFRSLVQLDLPNVVSAGYYSGYFPPSGSNFWSTTSTTYVNATPQGTIPAITTRVSSGFGTVTGAASSLPGVAFTAQRTGVVEVEIKVLLGATNGVLGGLQLWESTTSTELDTSIVAGSPNQSVYTLRGFMAITASTAYTFQLRGNIASGSITFANITASTNAGLAIRMQYL